MPNLAAKLVPGASSDDQRQTFDAAMAQIQRCGEPPIPSKTPIAVRKQTAPDDPATQKRALTEAARAIVGPFSDAGPLRGWCNHATGAYCILVSLLSA